MAPQVSVKAFFLSTLWTVAATSSAPPPPVVAATGKIWSVWIVDNNTYIV